jgi:DNA polymerase (family 10)
VIRTESKTRRECSVVLSEGFKANLIVVKPEEFALALWHATGSAAHLKTLQPIATKKKLNIVSGNGNFIRGSSPSVRTERDIYKRLGLQYVPPEMREDAGEIEAALKDKLPEDLITTDDIQGMVHCHTMYSDGKHSVAQMVAAAEAMGMKYITITDHSPTAFYAGGVKIDRLHEQW